MNEARRCPEPQTLQAFVEGRLPATERLAVLAHLDECESCMSAIDLANEILRDEPRQRAQRTRGWWMAVAAALAIVVAGLGAWRALSARRGPTMATLVAASPRTARAVEPRLSGGFAWAAYAGPNRSGGNAPDEQRLELAGIAGAALQRAHADGSAASQHVAGVAMLLTGSGDAAISMLETATRLAPDDAKTWSDLAAAQYAAAETSEQASRYAPALAAADRALRLAPDFAEALFNRALILERLGLPGEARKAWQRYLQIDAASPWANEARAHLAKLPATRGASRFDQQRPRLEAAAIAGDAATVAEIVRTDPQRARAFGEAEYLGRWGEAAAAQDDAGAARDLTVARAIGDAVRNASGESLLRDAVRAIDEASPAQRAGLASAHVAYRRGRIAYARHLPAAAEPDLLDAASRFGATPMALVARYYAANTRFDQADVAGARAALEGLMSELASRPGDVALGGEVRWELALCHMAVDDWTAATPLLTDSAAMFRRIGERSNLGSVDTLLADALAAAGRPDDSAAARIRSFALGSGDDERGDRLAVSVATAATAELRTGRRDAARALFDVAQSIARGGGNDALRVDILMQTALLDAADGDAKSALREAVSADDAAHRLADPPLRARAVAQAQLASAAAKLPHDPAAARERAAAAIRFFGANGFTVHLPLAYLLRGRAEERLAARDEAAHDFEAGIAALEQHKIEMARDVAASGVLDAADDLFGRAVALALDRGDTGEAFRAIERHHGSAITITDLQQRLRGTATAVISLEVLPRRVVAFAITARDAAVSQRTIEPQHLNDLLTRAAALTDDAALRELYDLLIRPSESSLAAARNLVVVPGATLDAVPFAALLDGESRSLLVRMPVAMAASAASLTRAPHTAPGHLVGIALPSGASTRLAALPEATGELADVAAAYPNRASTLPATATFADFERAAARAGVIHVAGHTERVPGSSDDALVFAGGETVSWRAAAASPVSREAVVVLAACETLRRPRSPQTRALSIGAGFLGAGAAEVIGTLAPIGDRAARALFRDVHRNLAAGAGAAAAVREAQLSAIARGDIPLPEWRALAVLTTRID